MNCFGKSKQKKDEAQRVSLHVLNIFSYLCPAFPKKALAQVVELVDTLL